MLNRLIEKKKEVLEAILVGKIKEFLREFNENVTPDEKIKIKNPLMSYMKDMDTTKGQSKRTAETNTSTLMYAFSKMSWGH